MYLHPGVYIEEIPSGSRPIEAASTSTALIVGYASKGPLNTPTLLFSFDQYVTQFGGIVDFHGSGTGLPKVDYMGHTVRAFFNNGGSKAYIVRLAADSTAHPLVPATAKLIVPKQSATTVGDINSFVNVSAANPGIWANKLEIRAAANGATPIRYTIAIGRLDGQGNFVASEVFTDVSFDANDTQDFIGTKLNGVSPSVKAEVPSSSSTLGTTDTEPFLIGSLTSGAGIDMPAAGSGFSVVLDSDTTNPVPVSFAAAPASLAAAAAEIEKDVRGSATTGVKGAFTCTVEGGRLVLRSGSRVAASKVEVTAGSPDASAKLKLNVNAIGLDKATSQTGAEAFVGVFSKGSVAILGGGADGGLPVSGDYESLLPELKNLRDISIILMPGQTWSSADATAQAIIGSFKAHAEAMKNRMVIIDPADGPPFFTSSLDFIKQGFPTSPHAVTYYPWLEVANPHYHAELRPERARTVFVPPSGFAAGLWAKTDGRRGVWKAPAGLQASLTGAANTRVKIGDDEQDQLNPVGVNCFRRIISDIVVWGSRTLATKSDPENRYVPVKRTAMMLGESIYQGIQWAVFEPNDHRLWSSLRLNIEAFMGTLFRSGAFQGEKASDAYFVRCGLGDTMTQAEIDAGQVIVLVGFAPLKPAEFVIVRIQQIVGKQ